MEEALESVGPGVAVEVDEVCMVGHLTHSLPLTLQGLHCCRLARVPCTTQPWGATCKPWSGSLSMVPCLTYKLQTR